MELEPLLIDLGLNQYIPQLSEWRDDLIRQNAVALLAKDEEIAAVNAALATAQAAYQGIEAERADIIAQVAAANGDPALLLPILARLAVPYVEQQQAAAKAAALAQAAELEAKAAEIRASLEN